ncbi:immunoglobulin-like domain-containing receptor 2 isoform X2 [Petromyzon marinus]|uniref:immunoglobulin-like domain-containing receptor 2 isoform X2 n=1 Tax=Petromyzon marinus TaxID=7757 RepID=UPI003F70AAF2
MMKMMKMKNAFCAGLFCALRLFGAAVAVQVFAPRRMNVAMLFSSATLRCDYTAVGGSSQPPIVLWKFKPYCRDRLSALFAGPASQGTSDYAEAKLPGYDSNVDCPEEPRPVRIVATKHGNAVTLGDDYKRRSVTVVNDADLYFGQTEWGDGGFYLCSVVSNTDLTGDNEVKMELWVLGKTIEKVELLPGFQIANLPDWLFVLLVVLGGLLLIILLAVCWCQCCPHTCCCYVRCPCCPRRCCCPRALYEAGKAATYGYASDAPSLSGLHAAREPLSLYHVPTNTRSQRSQHDASVRSGYRVQADRSSSSMKVLYYVEKELAKLDPSRLHTVEKASSMSELTSLHDDNGAGDLREALRHAKLRALPPISDLGEGLSLGSGTGAASRNSVHAASRGRERDGAAGGYRDSSRHGWSCHDQIGQRWDGREFLDREPDSDKDPSPYSGSRRHANWHRSRSRDRLDSDLDSTTDLGGYERERSRRESNREPRGYRTNSYLVRHSDDDDHRRHHHDGVAGAGGKASGRGGDGSHRQQRRDGRHRGGGGDRERPARPRSVRGSERDLERDASPHSPQVAGTRGAGDPGSGSVRAGRGSHSRGHGAREERPPSYRVAAAAAAEPGEGSLPPYSPPVSHHNQGSRSSSARAGPRRLNADESVNRGSLRV